MGERMSTKIASHVQRANAKPSLERDLARQTFSDRSYGSADSPFGSSEQQENHSLFPNDQTTTAILKILKEERGKKHSQ